MQITIAKLLALLIGITYLVILVSTLLAAAHSTAEVVVRSCQDGLIILIPVALIWFPEQIGAATGYIGHSMIDSETPPVFVAFMGWVFLVGLPIAVYFLWR